MKTPTTRRRVLRALSLCTIVTGTAVGGALLFELSVIGHAVSDFRREEAIAQAGIARGEPASPEERINPPWLKQFGLDRNLYKDTHGYFSPTASRSSMLPTPASANRIDRHTASLCAAAFASPP